MICCLQFALHRERCELLVKGIIINGKFFTQKLTGVQRYAIEIVNALDKLISPGQLEIAIPKNARNVPCYRNIRVRTVGHFTGVLWEQISFPIYALRHMKMPMNLCNASPLLIPGFVCVHDVKVKACPQYFRTLFVMWYRLLFINTMHRANLVVTVSEFSKSEIKRYYGEMKRKIHVVPSCWEHYAKIGYDEKTLDKYQLLAGEFYFALGSLDPNKNIKWIADVARNNQDSVFAIAGFMNQRVFAEAVGFAIPPNLRFLGYVSDKESKTLMRECRAFLFPSFYEGFGLPPLEALSAGAKRIVVSDIPVMHDIFGDIVDYIDPYCNEVDLTGISEISDDDRNDVLGKYSWDKSAREWLVVLDDYLNQTNTEGNL